MTTGRQSVSASSSKTRKGEQTRARILEAALELFRARGYERTTMRAVSKDAGVAVGNAYYYFESKEHLIQAFYERTHREHLAACAEVLENEADLETRLLGVMRAKLGTLMPYHRFAGTLFRTAADPKSPLHPLSDESQPLRREATAVFARLVEGSTTRVAPALADELPNLLWLYHMGVILYWIHDTSPGCDRSYRLMERTVGLVSRLISVATLPPMRPLLRSTLKLAAELRRGGVG